MYYTRSMFTDYSSMNKILDENKQKGALWLGDFSAASDKQLLNEKNIKTVLTTASGLGITFQPQDCIVHHQYNLLDNPSQNISHCFDATYKDIDEGLKRGGVLVHCAAGISRSATCVIAYLMKKNGTSFHETLSFVRDKRRVVCPNLGFEKQLKNFEKYLNQEIHKSDTSQIGKNVNNKKNRQQQISVSGNTSGNPKGMGIIASAAGNQFGQIGISYTPKKPTTAGSEERQLFLSVQKETDNFLNWERNEAAKRNASSLVETIEKQPEKKMPILNQLPRGATQQPKVRLLSMGNPNMAQLLSLKLSQNDPNLKIISLNKKIVSPSADINQNQNNFNVKKGRIPQSILETKFNCVGPNIVTYSAQGELRASSRGPAQLNNRKNNQNPNRVQSFATMTNFRKQAF